MSESRVDRLEQIRQRRGYRLNAGYYDADELLELDADIQWLLKRVGELREQNKELLADNQRMHGKLSSLATERQSHAFWATF